MPIYEYECTNPDCQMYDNKWEEFQFISEEAITICKHCKTHSAVKALSLPALGLVELTGQDYIKKMQNDVKSLSQKAASDENTYANLLGEDKYQSMAQSMDDHKNNKI